MTTYFLDPVNGSDANDGTTFANRKKTIAAFTVAILNPGDTVRVMESATPTSLGQSATWTNNSSTVTLTTAVNATIDNCDSAWTAAANVTATAVTTTKREGTGSANLAVASAFTTGKIAHHATGALDLSAYQQVSFMIRSNLSLAAGVLTLTLCSDTAGATPVHTFTIPAISSGVWVPVVGDNGAALSASIQSVAINAASDPGVVTLNIDNIVACKASGSADSITHRSLIGKANNLAWTATTAYSLNDKRRPTQPNRNGFQYKVTTAGTTGAAEPTWPEDIGATVADGTVVWTCVELEDSWFPICAISGTSLTLEGDIATANNTTIRGYQGPTETVATYKREPTPDSAQITGTTTQASSAIQDSGTAAGGFITFSGGWDSTAMTSQSGETWMDSRTGGGTSIGTSGVTRNFVVIENLNSVRYGIGLAGALFNSRIKNSHHLCHTTNGVNLTSSGTRLLLENVACRMTTNAFNITAAVIQGKCIQCDGQPTTSAFLQLSSGYSEINYLNFRGNNTSVASGIGAASGGIWARIKNLVTANNQNLAINAGAGEFELVNPTFGEASPIGSFTAGQDGGVKISKWGGDANDHRTYTHGGQWQSTTSQRHAASGIAWVFNPTITQRGELYPLRSVIARIPCVAGEAKNLTIWTRRDATDIKGRLMVRGGQIAGVAKDTYVDCTPAINTWEQSGVLSFTPTENGVVEVEFHVWDGVGTTNSFWIDDLATS